MARRFVRDRTFERKLLGSRDMRNVLERTGEAIAARARQLAPDDPDTVTDDLRSSIRVDMIDQPDGWTARVVADDYKAAWKEFGTSREAAKPYLRPAAEAELGPLADTGRE